MSFKKIILAAVLVLMTVISIAMASDGPVEEYRLKSSFLFTTCKFVQWPESQEMISNPYRAIIMAVLGKLPEGSAILIPSNKTIGKRNVVVTQITELEEIDNCNILFITTSEAYRINEIMRRVGEKQILTVGDTPGLCKRGVILNFFIKDKKIAFEFNPSAAKKAKIQMDSFFYARGVLVNSDGDLLRKNP